MGKAEPLVHPDLASLNGILPLDHCSDSARGSYLTHYCKEQNWSNFIVPSSTTAEQEILLFYRVIKD